MSAIKFTVINTNAGREIGAHIGGNLVAIRTNGAWIPSYEDRCMGLLAPCPLIMQSVSKAVRHREMSDIYSPKISGGAICTAAFDGKLRAVAAMLEAIGWTLSYFDIDVPSERARAGLRKGALEVTFDAQRGRSSITREMVEGYAETIGRRGDRFVAHRLRTRFIGRTRCEDMRSGLRFLSDYIADNSQSPRIDIHNAIAGLLT